MLATVGDHSDLPATLKSGISSRELGQLVFLLNQLNYKIEHDETGLEDVQRAITAVLEKQLTSAHSQINPHLGGELTSTADILVQLFSDPTIAEQAAEIVEEFENAYNTGLLAKLDEPQMMTPLWEHQRDALENWVDSGGRGYANMATATGKTVLGLAAIATRYGSLHPLDDDLDTASVQHGGPRAKVLVVAHNDLILEQWRREFDRHLNIPRDRTQGSDDITLEWGIVHFRTAQALINREHIAYDLVILDEAHHYANGSGWGQLLDSFESEVLALSGSVDEGEAVDSKLRERLEDTIGPEIKRFTVRDAQANGVIPMFDWEVQYVPAGNDSDDFVEVTQQANERFRAFRERLTSGTLVTTSDQRLRTHNDICRFSHTTEGKELKQTDDEFKDLVTTLFSRRTQRWNQFPRLGTVCDTVARYAGHQVVVLTNNNAQIEELARLLKVREDVTIPVYTIFGSDSSTVQRDTVDEFDDPETPGVLIGTGDLIGEGVDMQHADVGINMSTGNVNKQLIQRIGRILRNPDGEKDATFVNLVAVPTASEAQAPADDGQALLEAAQEFLSLGAKFDNHPRFTASADEVWTALSRLLTAGADRIKTLADDGVYDWPDQDIQREQLDTLLTSVDPNNSSEEILQAWSVTQSAPGKPAEPDDPASTNTESPGADQENETEANDGPEAPQQLSLTLESQEDGEFKIGVTNQDGDAVSDAFVSAVGDDVIYRRTSTAGKFWIPTTVMPCTVAVRHPTEGVRVLKLSSS